MYARCSSTRYSTRLEKQRRGANGAGSEKVQHRVSRKMLWSQFQTQKIYDAAGPATIQGVSLCGLTVVAVSTEIPAPKLRSNVSHRGIANSYQLFSTHNPAARRFFRGLGGFTHAKRKAERSGMALKCPRARNLNVPPKRILPQPRRAAHLRRERRGCGL